MKIVGLSKSEAKIFCSKSNWTQFWGESDIRYGRLEPWRN